MPQPTDREQTIAGLRELLDFLEANPDVPVSSDQVIYYSIDATLKRDHRNPSERRHEVDRVAALIDRKTRDNGHYLTSRHFGPNVEYKAVSVDPGPKHGVCAICRSELVRSPGSDGLAGRLCTPCLGPDADLIDPIEVAS